ncbi:MAG: hypothetical protein A3A72_05890, partial [Deltaproteobacteria bacterium RIFCSPLOWO2_01_FULL_38_9]
GYVFGESLPIILKTLDQAEAAQFLGTADSYTQHLSLLDRSVRLKTPKDVSNEEYLAYVAGQALSWELEEREKIEQASELLNRALSTLNIKANFPLDVFIIKTTGEEEAHSAYTRGNAIILPAQVLHNSLEELASLLFHEFFHVFSRLNPTFRNALYGVLPFKPLSKEVKLPQSVLEIRLTNPDAYHDNHFIPVYYNEGWINVVPVIVLNIQKKDITEDLNFFNYLYLRLWDIENKKLLTAYDTDYRYQVSQNTSYIIHPEEIMADNFMWLLRREVKLSLPESVNNPKVLDNLKEVLQTGE